MAQHDGATLDGLQNFRDTGGTPLVSGGTTRPGVLFRSEGLDRLTAAGVQALASSSIGMVVDLRTPQERESAPDRLPRATPPISRVELPLLEGAMTGMARVEGDPAGVSARIEDVVASLPSLGELYTQMLSDGATTFAAIAALVAAPTDERRGGVLVHCTAGKDRTGVATALLLDAVGATRQAVVADYTLSATRLSGPWADAMLARLDALGIERTDAVSEMAVASPAAAIERALAWVDDRGGSAAYLESGGLSAEHLDRLGRRLVG